MGPQLAQANPAAATDVELYAPPSLLGARQLTLVVCETGGAATTFDVYHDVDGIIRTAVTALHFQNAIGANRTIELRLPIDMHTAADGLGVESASGNVTFTLYGQEYVL